MLCIQARCTRRAAARKIAVSGSTRLCFTVLLEKVHQTGSDTSALWTLCEPMNSLPGLLNVLLQMSVHIS